MNQNNRLIINTTASYIRSVFSAVLALFSSRWVLNTLGQTDYGLFGVVGSLVYFITFLNSIMAASASRHFSYSIGEGNSEKVNEWFNTALRIHLGLAVALIILGWPIGSYLIDYHLVIPADRYLVCTWVFRITLISTFIGMASVPFIAMFTAKQVISEVALWGMVYSFLVFIFSWSLETIKVDHLLGYAIGMVIIIAFIQLGQVYRALTKFEECKINLKRGTDWNKLKELFTFASWNLIDPLGALLTGQGTTILLNMNFGPKVNAAYNIGNQVTAQANQLSTALISSFSPEITASEGRNDRSRVILLMNQTSKFGVLLILFFAVPLMLEMDYVLKIWLQIPPTYTSTFCILILLTIVIDRLSTGHMIAINASGKIAGFQSTIGTLKILTLPLAWLFIEIGFRPTSVGIAFIIVQTVCTFGRVLWARHIFNISIMMWLKNVVIKSFIIAIFSASSAYIWCFIFQPSLIRLILSSATSIIVIIATSWIFALDVSERIYVKNLFGRLMKKIKEITKKGV